jgi:hypothetical protein
MINKIQKKDKIVELKPYIHADGRSELNIGTNDAILFQTYFAYVNVKICPQCGEVSFYLNESDLKELNEKKVIE